MERSTPMDRLLCGDVGYGKTEVALRAVMKCVLDGKQAAILVPTTVLAQQHYATALNRFRSFPVRIEVLSRFKTPAQKKQIYRMPPRERSTYSLAHTRCCKRVCTSRTLAFSSSTRSSASA